MTKDKLTVQTEIKLGKGTEEVSVILGEGMTVVTDVNGMVHHLEEKEGGVILADYQGKGFEMLSMENSMKEEDTARNPKVPAYMEEETENFLKLHAEVAELNKKLNASRDKVRKYMSKNSVDEIVGKDGRYVSFAPAKASNSTARYTDFLLKDIQSVLEGPQLRKVTEIRVNADKLTVLLNDPSQVEKKTADRINDMKVTKEGTARFVVKRK